ncbi:MAG: GDYXXLXY domain-containing protein [Gammaproteobacteria bacterium]|nr:GDYXXLXY domain-containing protein [Gammaproteobacteria bacterium]
MFKKTTILWLTTLIIFSAFTYLVYKKEVILSQGTTMLIALAPVDPRSLIQGDYMTLRYSFNRTIAGMTAEQTIMDGHIVVTLNENQVASIVRIYNRDTPLKSNEYLLSFRKRATGVRIASEAFFFQEGHANDFNKARFGKIKVSPDGDSILTGLYDKSFRPLVHEYSQPAKPVTN